MNRAQYKQWSICRINGKNTWNLGVAARRHPVYGDLQLSNIPRTLIDATVRPEYSGGVATVLKAFCMAPASFASRS